MYKLISFFSIRVITSSSTFVFKGEFLRRNQKSLISDLQFLTKQETFTTCNTVVVKY